MAEGGLSKTVKKMATESDYDDDEINLDGLLNIPSTNRMVNGGRTNYGGDGINGHEPKMTPSKRPSTSSNRSSRKTTAPRPGPKSVKKKSGYEGSSSSSSDAEDDNGSSSDFNRFPHFPEAESPPPCPRFPRPVFLNAPTSPVDSDDDEESSDDVQLIETGDDDEQSDRGSDAESSDYIRPVRTSYLIPRTVARADVHSDVQSDVQSTNVSDEEDSVPSPSSGDSLVRTTTGHPRLQLELDLSSLPPGCSTDLHPVGSLRPAKGSKKKRKKKDKQKIVKIPPSADNRVDPVMYQAEVPEYNPALKEHGLMYVNTEWREGVCIWKPTNDWTNEWTDDDLDRFLSEARNEGNRLPLEKNKKRLPTSKVPSESDSDDNGQVVSRWPEDMALSILYWYKFDDRAALKDIANLRVPSTTFNRKELNLFHGLLQREYRKAKVTDDTEPNKRVLLEMRSEEFESKTMKEMVLEYYLYKCKNRKNRQLSLMDERIGWKRFQISSKRRARYNGNKCKIFIDNDLEYVKKKAVELFEEELRTDVIRKVDTTLTKQPAKTKKKKEKPTGPRYCAECQKEMDEKCAGPLCTVCDIFEEVVVLPSSSSEDEEDMLPPILSPIKCRPVVSSSPSVSASKPPVLKVENVPKEIPVEGFYKLNGRNVSSENGGTINYDYLSSKIDQLNLTTNQVPKLDPTRFRPLSVGDISRKVYSKRRPRVVPLDMHNVDINSIDEVSRYEGHGYDRHVLDAIDNDIYSLKCQANRNQMKIFDKKRELDLLYADIVDTIGEFANETDGDDDQEIVDKK